MSALPIFRCRSVLRVFLCTLAYCGGLVVARAAGIDIRYVPEMERMEEVDRWAGAQGKGYAEDRKLVLAAWKEVGGSVQKKVTPAEVIKLSKWAKAQMQGYAEVPALDRPDFQPHSANAAENKVVFEATMQVLPTHSPLVTRWLKLFVVYDRGRRVIERVVVTIRGEVQE